MPYKYQNTICINLKKCCKTFLASLLQLIFTELIGSMPKLLKYLWLALLTWQERKTYPGISQDGTHTGVGRWNSHTGEKVAESERRWDISCEDGRKGRTGGKGQEELDKTWELRKSQAFSGFKGAFYKCFMRKMSRTIFLIHNSSNFS